MWEHREPGHGLLSATECVPEFIWRSPDPPVHLYLEAGPLRKSRVGPDPTGLVSLHTRALSLPHEEDKARESPSRRQEGATIRTLARWHPISDFLPSEPWKMRVCV